MEQKRNTFKQLFFVKKQRVNQKGESPIYLRITINGKTSDMSVHRDVVYDNWDVKMGTVKPNVKRYKSLNSYLFSIQTSIYEHYKYLRESNIELTPQILKNAYLGIKVEVEKKTLIGIFSEHNQELEKLIGIDYSKSTVTKYKSTLKHIRFYMLSEIHKEDINVEEINQQFVKGFDLETGEEVYSLAIDKKATLFGQSKNGKTFSLYRYIKSNSKCGIKFNLLL